MLVKQTQRSLAWGKLVVAEPDKFGDVETYVMFIGYPRSGQTLIGAVLNAHPDAVVAHELNALAMLQYPFMTRDKLFAAHLERERWFGELDYHWRAYDFRVEGQWQGRFRDLKVIGDKRGAGAGRYLKKHPQELEVLQDVLGPEIDLKIIHVVRNPYDNVASMQRHATRLNHEQPYQTALADYIDLLAISTEVIERYAEQVLTVYYEAFASDPQQSLMDLWQFIGREADADYLQACADIVFVAPTKARHRVDWTDEQLAQVSELVVHYEHLKHYTFDD